MIVWNACVCYAFLLCEPRNEQTWCSLLIVWELVYQNKNVVYELCEQGQVLVIPANNGPIRCVSTIATGGTVPELNDRETVHVFDGKASACHEPAASRAFLIGTTSRNSRNFTQTSRRAGMFFYCIPSYEVDELLRCANARSSVWTVKWFCSAVRSLVRQ